MRQCAELSIAALQGGSAAADEAQQAQALRIVLELSLLGHGPLMLERGAVPAVLHMVEAIRMERVRHNQYEYDGHHAQYDGRDTATVLRGLQCLVAIVSQAPGASGVPMPELAPLLSASLEHTHAHPGHIPIQAECMALLRACCALQLGGGGGGGAAAAAAAAAAVAPAPAQAPVADFGPDARRLVAMAADAALRALRQECGSSELARESCGVLATLARCEGLPRDTVGDGGGVQALVTLLRRADSSNTLWAGGPTVTHTPVAPAATVARGLELKLAATRVLVSLTLGEQARNCELLGTLEGEAALSELARGAALLCRREDSQPLRPRALKLQQLALKTMLNVLRAQKLPTTAARSWARSAVEALSAAESDRANVDRRFCCDRGTLGCRCRSEEARARGRLEAGLRYSSAHSLGCLRGELVALGCKLLVALKFGRVEAGVQEDPVLLAVAKTQVQHAYVARRRTCATTRKYAGMLLTHVWKLDISEPPDKKTRRAAEAQAAAAKKAEEEAAAAAAEAEAAAAQKAQEDTAAVAEEEAERADSAAREVPGDEPQDDGDSSEVPRTSSSQPHARAHTDV